MAQRLHRVTISVFARHSFHQVRRRGSQQWFHGHASMTAIETLPISQNERRRFCDGCLRLIYLEAGMEFMHWLFFGPSKLIAWHPYAGFIVGATLLAVAAACALQLSDRLDRQWFRQPAVLAGLLWLLFNLYELQVVAVFLGQGNQTRSLVRIDLLVLTPILYTLTGLAIYQGWQRVVGRRSNE